MFAVHAKHYVHRNSWHWRLGRKLWQEEALEGTKKACSYWWGRIIGGLLLFLLWQTFWYGAIKPFAWFLGLHEAEKVPGQKIFAKNQRFAPWQFILPALAFGLLAYFLWQDPENTIHVTKVVAMIGGGIIVGLVALGGILFAFVKGWRRSVGPRVRSDLRTLWKRACPDLVILDE